LNGDEEKSPVDVKAPSANKAPADKSPDDSDAGLPSLGGEEGKSEEPEPKEDGGSEEVSPEDSEQARADAAKSKAELEAAKAEKDRAEKEIKQQSYIKLGSHAGTQFLLSKILDHAFKTNTIDSLAGEFVQKLKIQTPEDLAAFSEDSASYRVLPGFPELLASMKAMATKQPDSADTEETTT